MTVEKVTNTVAAASVISPLWLPSLAEVSQAAALMLPILGCLYLLVQLYWKISGRDRDRD
ncbi:hypothetical protein EN858_15065 [Mesorhizobium sp. M4B.F.Ca.ET.215.01.1.1]|uniref:hypothetical protein n=1 Tax=unclassified Mesorhizobium TaxID=325217 RepID=UPI00109341F6|nr:MULTISPECIES: hypothetical protein [unclassified Mesorhizobium]TGQ11239.1 hypothetical protein EN858_15065 [Mesorhizobium sp. M4B.F.Ca.ET.215.01.1.1]TGR04708.1 hypothetical protein EN846_13015 [Mesorhizobium sp. M4B.F.Ca.ET.203.01.1.1]TGV26322.1 hypothetical protein EN786_12415 [Mesorhizobium sp. M4B.F.Ca.ET.143.01.1.1]